MIKLATASPDISRPSLASLASGRGLYIFFAVLVLVGGLISPSFVSANNINNMLVQFAPLAIVVIGQTFVIISRGLDLSVASIMATAAITTTMFRTGGSPEALIVVASLGVGLGTGLLNGLLVTKRNVSPFLATLATAIMLQGLRFAATSGAPSGNIPEIFKLLGTSRLFGMPISVLIAIGLGVAFGVLLHRSLYGRHLYIVGGNPVAGELVGINPDRTVIVSYIISGLMASIAGLILAGFAGVVDNNIGRGFELDSIVAAVIGGVALSGGRGGIPGALTGAAILVAIFNLVLLIGAPVQLQMIIKGIVIVVAAAFYVKRRQI